MTSGEPSRRSAAVAEWLESAQLSRIAARVAYEFGLPPQDVPDLLQELRLALWIAGEDAVVNPTWIFHTANHKALDLLSSKRRLRMAAMVGSESPSGSTPSEQDLSHLVHARVARLPERVRTFYALRYREGLSQREIALRMDICRSSVRWLDHQCVRMIKGSVFKRDPGRESI